MYWETYFDRITEILSAVRREEAEGIRKAAEEIVDCVQRGNNLYIFGCTHAGILSEEAFYRSGGLALFNPIFFPGLTPQVTPVTLTSQLERQQSLGRLLVEQYGLRTGDLLFLHSVSGRNPVPVEAALCAKSQGIRTVCITSVEYSRSERSRHESGKRLFEVCDLVLDNHCPPGDAVVEVDALGQNVAPASTVSGAAILNAVVAESAAVFLERGIRPPFYLSANRSGGDEHNRGIIEQYRKQIFYL